MRLGRSQKLSSRPAMLEQSPNPRGMPEPGHMSLGTAWVTFWPEAVHKLRLRSAVRTRAKLGAPRIEEGSLNFIYIYYISQILTTGAICDFKSYNRQ